MIVNTYMEGGVNFAYLFRYAKSTAGEVKKFRRC